MKINNIAIVIFTWLSFLAGCATTVDWNAPDASEKISGMTVIERDVFKRQTKYLGPKMETLLDYFLIKAWKTDNGIITYQIYVHVSATDYWPLYYSANDSNGKQLDITLISQESGYRRNNGRIYDEDIGLNVTQDYLENAKTTGIIFKLYGKVGGEIPAGYIQGFLSVAK
jgi:hypothetical protein